MNIFSRNLLSSIFQIYQNDTPTVAAPPAPSVSHHHAAAPRVAAAAAAPQMVPISSTNILQWVNSSASTANGRHLAAMAVRRNLVLAPGKTAEGLGPTKTLPGYKEAGLGYQVGHVMHGQQACTKCKGANKAPFNECVVVPGYFRGSCVNCRYYNRQSLCSLCKLLIRSMCSKLDC
jgi:hypothetical protein